MNLSYQEFVPAFISETRDALEEVEQKINHLFDTYEDELIQDIFRAYHSLKGSAGLLQLDHIQDLSHEVEEFLSALILDSKKLEVSFLSVLVEINDYFKEAIDHIETNFNDTFQIDRKNKLLQKLHEKLSPPKNEVLSNSVTDFKDFQEKCSQFLIALQKYFKATPLDKVEPTKISQFQKEVKNLSGALEKSSNQDFTDSFNDLRDMLLVIDDDAVNLNENVRTFLLDGITHLIREIEAPAFEIVPDPEPEKLSDSITDNPITEGYQSVSKILIDLDHFENEPEEQKTTAMYKKDEPGSTPKNATPEKTYLQEDQTIRVSTRKLDRLIELIGELHSIKSVILDHHIIKDSGSQELDQLLSYFDKTTHGIQDLSMGIRMIPIDGLFQKARRVARETAEKRSKSIRLDLAGSKTEIDRSLLEKVTDALMHLVRNSIDHGIEEPDLRKKRGKPDEGTLHLQAEYRGGEVWIRLSDDGNGVDLDKVRQKAIDQGILSDTEEMSDKQLQQLIFHPGFSTKESANETSGRGMGMNIVKKNIETLRGSIEIDSTFTKGTTVILKIPLSLCHGSYYRSGRHVFFFFLCSGCYRGSPP